MRKKCWFYICIIESIIIFCALLIILIPSAQTDYKEADLKEYVSQFAEENNYLPDAGYIPDATIAKEVGSPIIERLCGIKYGFTDIEYDPKNRLWRIEKWNPFHPGAMIVIEQDSGKVIKALLGK